MSVADDNSMAERLTQARDQWLAFTSESDARLLVWRVREGERAVIESFITQESDADDAASEDLFLELVSPYQSSHLHGFALASELTKQYEELAADDDVDASFRPPLRREHEDDAQFFVRLLSAFRAHAEGDSGRRLATVLSPRAVADAHAYLLWLQRLVHAAPVELRFVVIDELERPAYDALVAAEPKRVLTQLCGFDLTQTAAQVGACAEEEPSALFHRLQLQLAELLEKGELASALPVSTAATQLAVRHGWPQLGAAVQMTMGATYASRGSALEAVRAYVEAERLASACEAAESAAAKLAAAEDETSDQDDGPSEGIGLKLRLAARLSQGAMLIAHRAFKQAAELYLQTIPLTQAAGDGRGELDCYRLASVCRAQLGEEILAWELGMRGLACGAALDEETRRTSTLAYLFEHLVSLGQKYGEFAAHRSGLEEQAVRLLGPDWRAQLPTGAAA